LEGYRKLWPKEAFQPALTELSSAESTITKLLGSTQAYLDLPVLEELQPMVSPLSEQDQEDSDEEIVNLLKELDLLIS
jgi:hypothetical protein